jgi:long-chain acyl-CoA synthetase
MLIQAFLETVARYPKKIAIKDPTRRLTYRQLATFAKAIRRLVMRETDCPRVGVMMPSSAGGLGCLLGTLWAGRTVIPLNFLLPSRELAGVVADAQIDRIITTEHFEEQMAGVPAQPIYLERINLKHKYLLARFLPTPAAPRVEPDDTAAIIYTSGTTGQPKGVCLSHDNILCNARAAYEELRIRPESVLLGVIPPFHVFGLTVVVFLPMILGATVSSIPRFSPQAAYRAIQQDNIDVLIAVPSMYAAIARLKSLEHDECRNIRLAASGGEPLPRTVYDLVYQKMGIRLIEGYGLTETSPIISADFPWAHKVGTVGKPLPNVEVQLRDEKGNVLDHDQEGELCVRGPSVMKGYYNKPEETAAVVDKDGWFRTGDIVRIDEDGYITITGRAKDLIITGGENVYPREVEAVLEEHAAVAEAAVIGKPDPSRGEVVVAFVALKEDAKADTDELRSFCRDRLAGFKTPREVHIREEFPRGPTGKILKRQLKEEIGS